jgi:hypothetical protein
MCVIPIGASSKIIQLRTIVSNKSAGQVSRTGWAIASYSNLGMLNLLIWFSRKKNISNSSTDNYQSYSNKRHEYGD